MEENDSNCNRTGQKHPPKKEESLGPVRKLMKRRNKEIPTPIPMEMMVNSIVNGRRPIATAATMTMKTVN